MSHLLRGASRGVCQSLFDKDASQPMANKNNRPRSTPILLSFCTEFCNKSMGMMQNPVRGAAPKERRRVGLVSESEDACLKVFVREQVPEPQASSLWIRPCIYLVLVEAMNRDDTNAG
jgi:hypothetical protein